MPNCFMINWIIYLSNKRVLYNLIRNRYQNEMNFFRSFILEDQAHMAEGFALALDLFEDLENRRRGNKYVNC